MAHNHKNQPVVTINLNKSELLHHLIEDNRTPGEIVLCNCRNECGSHPEEIICTDPAEAALAFAGGVLKAVCSACAVEFLKRLLT